MEERFCEWCGGRNTRLRAVMLEAEQLERGWVGGAQLAAGHALAACPTSVPGWCLPPPPAPPAPTCCLLLLNCFHQLVSCPCPCPPYPHPPPHHQPAVHSARFRATHPLQDCITPNWVGHGRWMLFDLTARRVDWGPALGGDGVVTHQSLPDVHHAFADVEDIKRGEWCEGDGGLWGSGWGSRGPGQAGTSVCVGGGGGAGACQGRDGS